MKRTRSDELRLQQLRSRIDARLTAGIFVSGTDCLGHGRYFHYWKWKRSRINAGAGVLLVTMA